MAPSGRHDEPTITQFNRLMRDFRNGSLNRSKFRQWEMELLLDIESCRSQTAGFWKMLARYEKVVCLQLENHPTTLLKFSEYLDMSPTERRSFWREQKHGKPGAQVSEIPHRKELPEWHGKSVRGDRLVAIRRIR